MKKLLHAVLFLTLGTFTINAQTLELPAPAGSGFFGENIVVFSNGNYVVTDAYYDEGIIENVGAVYLYNGKNHQLISILKGTTKNDRIGFHYNSQTENTPIVPLSNGDFIVLSNYWNNGSLTEAGAVTLVDGDNGLNGVVSASNSLVGDHSYDRIGIEGVTLLTNGNFVINSPKWNMRKGAVTWVDVSKGISGIVNEGNSLIDTEGEHQIFPTPDGNYVLISEYAGLKNEGALTFCNGYSGTNGLVSPTNSLFGNSEFDFDLAYITILKNGNYVLTCPYWDNEENKNVGAVTWCRAGSPVIGIISSANSLVGSHTNDLIWPGVKFTNALPSGNFIIATPFWDNETITNAGAVTWGNGVSGTSGIIGIQHSLVGTYNEDKVGEKFTILTNGNYVISSPNFDYNNKTDCGAVTWGNGNTGVKGEVNDINSLLGADTYDNAGYFGIVSLNNGNYIVQSSFSKKRNIFQKQVYGSVTWCNGTTGRSGIIGIENSITGSGMNHTVATEENTVIALANGNYAVSSLNNKYGGMITLFDGTKETVDSIYEENSLWTKSNYQTNITALSNGHFVATDPTWNNERGISTWCNGFTRLTGLIDSTNGLVGGIGHASFSNEGVVPLKNGNYIIRTSRYSEKNKKEVGSVVFGKGDGPTIGLVNNQNSLLGGNQFDQAGGPYVFYDQDFFDSYENNGIYELPNGNVVAHSIYTDYLGKKNTGAVTFINGNKGFSGIIDSTNSLVGRSAMDYIGMPGLVILSDSNFLIRTAQYDADGAYDLGALTYASGSTGISGFISPCNSIIGNKTNTSFFKMEDYAYNPIHKYVMLTLPSEKVIRIFYPDGNEIPTTNEKVEKVINGNTDVQFKTNNCQVIATTSLINPFQNIFSDTVIANLYVQQQQPQTYVKRHFDIRAPKGNDQVTGKVKLFFTQEEFDAFNAINSIKLPMQADDAIGKSNIRIECNTGEGNLSNGLPDSYSGNSITIDPADEQIVWNDLWKRWEISFELQGLGGFWLKSEGTLPLKWISVSGFLDANKQAVINWEVEENNAIYYTVEKSTDGRLFNEVYKVNSVGTGKNKYKFVDPSITDGNSWYRIRQTDALGGMSISEIVKLQYKEENFVLVYPNPANDYIDIRVSNQLIHTHAYLIDASGSIKKIIQLENGITKLNVSDFTKGIYILRFANGLTEKITIH